MKKEVSVREGILQLPDAPVYLVSTEHEGRKNIISISMFAYFSGRLLGIGVMPTRHSFGLISKSGQFVLNVVDEKTRGAVRICGENSGRDVDKFQLSGLTSAKATGVKAPLIEESPVNLECRVVKEVEIGGHVWFISEVIAAHVEEGYDWENGLLLKWIGNERYYYKFGKKVAKF